MALSQYSYLISRRLDPVFGLFIGISAASLRIRREEKEIGRDGKQTIALALRRAGVPEAWRDRIGATS